MESRQHEQYAEYIYCGVRKRAAERVGDFVEHPYGSFQNNGLEFVVNNPATPRAFDNFLWNDAIMSNVSQTGVGYADYQPAGLEAIQLLTGNGRVCDFDIYGRESLMSRLIYIRDNDTGVFWNVNWEPVRRAYEKYECTHGLGYTIICNVTEGIEAVFSLLVPVGNDPVELWKLSLVNRSGRARNLSIFMYNQFQFRYKWGFDSYGDMLYRSGGYSAYLNAVVADKHPHVRPHSHLTGFLATDAVIEAFDSARDAFVGIYGNLSAPDAVVAGRCTNTPGSSDATIGAMQLSVQLGAEDARELNFVLGAADGTAAIKNMLHTYLGKYDTYWKELKAKKAEMCSHHVVKTPDAHFNEMFNYWMKQQSAFGAAWCRWGWMGYRDIVQHGYGVCSYMPARTKEILREAVRYQYADGTAMRGWNPIDTKPYSDSAMWLAFTLTAYVRETADTALLNEVIPFYDEGEATLLGHIERALDFMENHRGAHGLCLIKFGDWNDSLTAVGKKGKGESVWLSEAYVEAENQLAALYAFLGDTEKEADARRRAEAMKNAIAETAWDGEWFVRCFDDDGIKVGSKENDEGQIFSESQGWALIAGIAPEKAAQVLDSCDKMLMTPHGYKLLAPTFTKVNERIGRISTMEPGICENGTIYTHTNIWLIMGMLRNGYTEKAYTHFKRLTAGYLHGDDNKANCPPYIYANCYYGPDHRNNAFQMEFAWITGSISWVNNVMAEEFLGVAADYNGLKIQPRLPKEWDTVTYRRTFRGAAYDFTITNGEGALYVTVDGKAIDGNVLPVFADGTHKVEVFYR